MINDRDDIKELLLLIEKYSAKADFILEIGPEFGNGSTRAFNNVMSKRTGNNRLYITVDIVDNIYPECRPSEPYWHFVLGDSRELSTVKKVQKICKGRKADIIFIDTIHNYDFIKKELPLWAELADKKTVWLFHDTWMLGNYNRMTDAIKEFSEESGLWKYTDLSTESNGLGALLPK